MFVGNQSSLVLEVIDSSLRYLGAAMNHQSGFKEMLALAQQLNDARIDVLDLGYAHRFVNNHEFIEELKRRQLTSRIAMLARAGGKGLEAAIKAKADEIFLVLPANVVGQQNPLHRSEFGSRFQNAIERVLANHIGVNIICRDVTKRNWLNMVKCVEEVSRKYPVKRIVLNDTAAVRHTPEDIAEIFGHFYYNLPEQINLCIHTHNSYGMAAENTYAAVEAGASTIVCSVNGIGESTRNADLNEVVDTLPLFYNRITRVKIQELSRISQSVATLQPLVESINVATSAAQRDKIPLAEGF